MSQASLLGLPVELRLQILGYLLLGGPKKVPAKKSAHSHRQISFDYESRYPAILQANQQIYNEGLSLLYGGKEFEVIVDEKGLHVCQCLYPNMSKQPLKLHTNFQRMSCLDMCLKVPGPDLQGDCHRNIHKYSFNLNKWVEVIADLHSIRSLRVALKPSSSIIEARKGYARSVNGHEHAAILFDRFDRLRNIKNAFFDVDGKRAQNYNVFLALLT